MGAAEDRREFARVCRSFAADNRGRMGEKADMLERCAELLESGRCVWVLHGEGVYGTACGNFYKIILAPNGESGFRYCPYCGGAIVDGESL